MPIMATKQCGLQVGLNQQPVNVLGNHWRASTSKLITYSQKGEWRVLLVNKKSQKLAEGKFIVE